MPFSSREERKPELSVRDICDVLFRHQWKFILFFLLVMSAVTLWTFISPEVYQSNAKLLVRLGRESVTLDPTATTGPVVSAGQSRENEIKSELEILRSQELVEDVVDTIGPSAFLKSNSALRDLSGEMVLKMSSKTRPPQASLLRSADGFFIEKGLSDRDKAILRISKNLEIEALKNSNIISISFKAKDQKLAQVTIEKLIAFYLDKHINVHRTAGSYEFFTDQTDHLRSALFQTEDHLRELKNKAGIASLEEQSRAFLKRMGDLQQEVEETEAALIASKAKVGTLQKTLASLPETQVVQETTGHPNAGADLMRDRLYGLQIKEQDLLSRFTEESEPVREIRRQISEAQSLLVQEERTRTQVTKGLNEAYKQTQLALLTERATVSSLQSKLKEMQAQLRSARGELTAINNSETQLGQVQREMAIQEASYRKYHEKLEEARIDHALEIGKISNISVVQPPTYPVKPIWPIKSLILGLGFLFGIMGGVGLAFFFGFIDHSFKRPEDVERRLNLPTLATIPHLGNDKIIPRLPDPVVAARCSPQAQVEGSA
ncbi:MAG: GumC family protein [Thermodesulfobacteriota bacterium]|jgi:uncharacterized protein involved in exopolysaccharide biosynthesis